LPDLGGELAAGWFGLPGGGELADEALGGLRREDRVTGGDGNGRALGDNVFDTAVTVLAGEALGNASTPRQATSAFPYLSAPQPSDLPPLIDYFHSPQATAQ
jgi:hypothetical protein